MIVYQKKQCSGECGKLYDYVYFRPNKNGKYGVHTVCPECKRRNDNIYSDQHRIERREYAKHYLQENKDKINTQKRNRKDPKKIVFSRARNRIYECLQTKTKRTISYLGMSGEEYSKYIENLFSPGMSWDNYGEWEIHHIIPLYFGREELLHYSNTYPLWKSEHKLIHKWIDTTLRIFSTP